jgi:NADH-quinone oxidoreductase subunit C
MSDDKPTTPPEETPAVPESEEKNEKQPLTDEEKAAKIAEAKAKAAARKAAEEAEPKDPWEEKPVPPTHEDASDDPDAVALGSEMPGVVLAADRFAGEVTLSVPADRIVDVCRFLKHDCNYRFLVDLTAVDWPQREQGRFDVIYWIHRHDDSKRLRLHAVVADEAPISSVTEVWKTADWMEREVYDLFGIVFEDHPGLERILTWEGFNGHPLRKDFPVEGIDTGAAIYPDVYPPGGGPPPEEAEEEEGGAA